MMLYLLSCNSPTSFSQTEEFSPSLPGVVHSLQWRYGDHCTGIEAIWKTNLPKDSLVQAMAGPKTKNPHFNDDAIISKDLIIDRKGRAHLPIGTEFFASTPTFLNLRVWGSQKEIFVMLNHSQNNGGFPVAESPKGPYGWAETTIPACLP